MNDIKGFTFYKNYYELIKYLPNKERLQVIDAILKYMFENQETQFTGLLSGIWINLKMPLENSKTNIENGKKGGRPKKPKETEPITETKSQKKPKAKANNISIFLFLISNFYLINNNNILKNKIIEYLEYKEYEKKEIYKEKGMNSLLVQIEKKAKEYGSEAVVDLITECMANNWKGIIWEKIKKPNNSEKMPEWFDKEIKQNKEGLDELNNLLEDFK